MHINQAQEADQSSRNMLLDVDSPVVEVAADIHACNVAHGWWDEERLADEQCLLYASEVLEAFERWRKAPDETMWLEIAEELADVVIRLLDGLYKVQGSRFRISNEFAAELGLQLPGNYSLAMLDDIGVDWVKRVDDLDELASKEGLTSLLRSMVIAMIGLENDDDLAVATEAALLSTAAFCAVHGLQLAPLVHEKIAKNWDRPMRHGGLRS